MAYINDKSLVFTDVTDFNLTHIFECGQAFRWEPLEIQEDGIVCYSGIADKHPAIIRFIPTKDERRGRLYIHIPDNIMSGKPEERSFWEHYLDLKRDYAKIKECLSKNDHIMRTAISFGEGIRILNQDPWETLISFIISQNNHIPRIKTCVEALCAEFGEPVGGDAMKSQDNGVTSGVNPASIAAQTAPGIDNRVVMSENGTKLKKYAFPRIETLASLKVTDLGNCRLGYRAEYIVEAARRVLDAGGANYLNSLRDMSFDKAEKELLAIKGVGPKVAACVLLFGLGHFEGFPIDVWIRKAMNELYGTDMGGSNAQAYALKRFGAYAGLAQQYLFYYMRNKAGR